MRFVFAIGAVISYFFLIFILAARSSQLVLVRESTELVFSPKDEKRIKVALLLMYAQTFLFFLLFCHKNYGGGILACIKCGLGACIMVTLISCVFFIKLAILWIVNCKRKKRLAALAEEQETTL